MQSWLNTGEFFIKQLPWYGICFPEGHIRQRSGSQRVCHTSSIVKNVESQAPPQTQRSETLGVGPGVCV